LLGHPAKAGRAVLVALGHRTEILHATPVMSRRPAGAGVVEPVGVRAEACRAAPARLGRWL